MGDSLGKLKKKEIPWLMVGGDNRKKTNGSGSVAA